MPSFDLANWEKMYARRGLPLRWFVRVETSEGERYREQTQTLDGRPMSVARCLVWDTSESMEEASWGQGRESRTLFSCLPHQMLCHAGDLILLTSPAVAPLAANTFTRRGDALDVLPHWPLHSIEGVWVEGVKLPTSTYSAAPEGIQWGAGAPGVGTAYFIRWKYLPLYRWSENEKGTLQVGAGGKALPQRGEIRLIEDFDPTKF